MPARSPEKDRKARNWGWPRAKISWSKVYIVTLIAIPVIRQLFRNQCS